MIKKILLISLLLLTILIFYRFVPFKFYSRAPLLLTLLFSVITGILALAALLNIFSYKEFKLVSKNERPVGALLISVFSVIVSFFVYYFAYVEKEKQEFKSDSIETYGVLIDKWTEGRTGIFRSNVAVHLKLKYQVANEEVISEHITVGRSENELPNKGDSLPVFYLKKNNSVFQTSWEKEIANYNSNQDPEQMRINKLVDSLISAQ